MKVTGVKLKNFLSYSDAECAFGPSVNIVSGENAAGKTNLIDSLYYASVGRSSRHSKDKELLKWDTETGAKVTVNIQKRFSKNEIDIYIDPLGKKRISIDSLPLSKIGELMGTLNVVFFSPDEMRLIKESPADRRRFLDVSLCQRSKVYFYTLQRYNALLAQRNKLLKTYKGRPALKDMLELVDRDIARAAALLITERKKFLTRLAPAAALSHAALTGGKEELRIVYETEEIAGEDLAAEIFKLLKNNFEADQRLEYTTTGPHRDDIKISAAGVDVRKFGSQGQQRTAVLSMKLAEIRLFEEYTGEKPVLLLDDVLSELDKERSAALFKAIEGVQTVITCTEADFKAPNGSKVFRIADRKIIEE